jgi:hemerythrin-like metal-binding protein
MKPVKFTSDLLSGVNDIDSQHRALFERTNRLFTMLESTEAESNEYAMLDFLFGYIHYHLAAEETVMQNAGIDGKAHAFQHDKLREETRELYREYKTKGSFDKGRQARLHFLIEFWFTNHIRYWDRILAEKLRQALPAPSLPMPRVQDIQGLWDDIDLESVEVVDLAGELTQYEINARKQRAS